MGDKFTKMNGLELVALCIKALTGIIGGSMVLEQNHPYITLAVLGIGAVSFEIVNYMKKFQK
jgi:uncharacterized membrane protein YhfC